MATPDGRWSPFVEQCDGQPFRGPNDCTFDLDGNLYFSDPFGSTPDRPVGAVYRATPSGHVSRVADGLAFPNGLAVWGDRGALFVAETHTNRILRFELTPDGSVKDTAVFCKLDDAGLGPDGIDFDTDGNLLVAHYGAGHVDVFSPSGERVEEIATPGERVSNLEFSGHELYITTTHGQGEMEDGMVVRYRRETPGQPKFADQPPSASA
jgi:gluconolactonase